MTPDSYSPKFDWDDILITPAVTSTIKSRYSSIHIDYVPLFTAPMDTVVDVNNCELFTKHGISVCLPRNAENQHFYVEDNNVFRSVSLLEFIHVFIERKVRPSYPICIDTANGHTKSLVDALKDFRKIHGSTPTIMVGNIANPKTLAVLDEAGADYCRVGIGNGSGCFLDGVLIKTEKGLTPIENVKVGDKVLTHLGNYREVISRSRFVSGAKMIKVNDQICTEDHEFLVVSVEDKEKINDKNYMEFAFWLEAKMIDEDRHLILEIDVND